MRYLTFILFWSLVLQTVARTSIFDARRQSDENLIGKIVRHVEDNFIQSCEKVSVDDLRLPSLCGSWDPEDCITLAVEFLLLHMPARDRGKLSVAYLGDNVGLALVARQVFPWASSEKIPWKVFLNDVLPYSVLSEPRDNWRHVLFRYLRKIFRLHKVADSMEAAILINEKAWEIVSPKIKFVAAPPNELNHYSPFEVMQSHNASCTGLSIFLTFALRSVGLPARVVGVPHWVKSKSLCPHKDKDPRCGNHNWVESYVGRNGALAEWHFFDQDSSPGKIDVGWFFPSDTDNQVSNSRNHSIYATSWAHTKHLRKDFYPLNKPASNFPMVWDWKDESIPAWDVTKWYHWKSKKEVRESMQKQDEISLQ